MHTAHPHHSQGYIVENPNKEWKHDVQCADLMGKMVSEEPVTHKSQNVTHIINN